MKWFFSRPIPCSPESAPPASSATFQDLRARLHDAIDWLGPRVERRTGCKLPSPMWNMFAMM